MSAEEARAGVIVEARAGGIVEKIAAKEAVMKAMGTGWNRNVGWNEIEVVRERGHAPTIALHGKTAEFAQRRKIVRFHLSLSHTADQAIAHVIAES